MSEKEEEKEEEPKIITLQDEGAKLNYISLGNGKEAFIYRKETFRDREESFRGMEVAGLRLGLSDKYRVFSPGRISLGTINEISEKVTEASGTSTIPDDFDVQGSRPEIESMLFEEGSDSDYLERINRSIGKLEEEKRRIETSKNLKIKKEKKKSPKETKYV